MRRIRPSAQELFGQEGTPTVAVVGAGIGGIAAGVNLVKAGIGTFTIYESSVGAGGTWWDTTYPGVDVDSNLYRYSFKPHDWTRTDARQAELQAYLADTVTEFGARPTPPARHHRAFRPLGSGTPPVVGPLQTGEATECHVDQCGRIPQRRGSPTGPDLTGSRV